jgi:tight adherence protein C
MTGLPVPVSGETAVIAAIGAVNFLAVLALAKALFPADRMAARARAHARRRQELRAKLLVAPRGPRARPVGYMRRLVERLKLNQGEEAKKTALLLAQAGFRSRDATSVFLTLRLGAPVVLALGAWLFALAALPKLPANERFLMGLAGMGAGVYLPKLLLKRAIRARHQKIHKGLSDALDLFVICAEAGLSLDAAMTRVGREIGAGAPELADELGLTAIELGFLPDRREALQNLAKRVDTPQVRGLVNTLAQTEKYGTPLAQSLRILAGEFRDTRMMKAEEKAARLPATLTVPMIVFILPPLFVVLIGPAIVEVLTTSFH